MCVNHNIINRKNLREEICVYILRYMAFLYRTCKPHSRCILCIEMLKSWAYIFFMIHNSFLLFSLLCAATYTKHMAKTKYYAKAM